MAKKKENKVSKRVLIELFESKVHPSVAGVKVHESHKSELTAKYESEWLMFYNEDRPNRNFSFGKEDACLMRVTQFKGKNYIEFNSIHCEITANEYSRLHKLLSKRINEEQKNETEAMVRKDLNLLQTAIEEKAKNEKRVTIVEKIKKENDEN